MADSNASNKLRKLNLAKDEDFKTLLIELRLIDETGLLEEALRALLMSHDLGRAMRGEPSILRGDRAKAEPLPVPPEFIAAIHDLRKRTKDLLEKTENFLQILEEGI